MKTYQKPQVKTIFIESAPILSGSLRVYNDAAGDFPIYAPHRRYLLEDDEEE